MSPSVLANMWKEEETKTKILEERLRKLLSEKEVRALCPRHFMFVHDKETRLQSIGQVKLLYDISHVII